MIFFSHSTNVFLILFFWWNLFQFTIIIVASPSSASEMTSSRMKGMETQKDFLFSFIGIKILIWVRFQLKVVSCVRVDRDCTRMIIKMTSNQLCSQYFDLQKCFRFQLFVVFCEVFQRWDNNFFSVFKRRWNFSFFVWRCAPRSAGETKIVFGPKEDCGINRKII